MILYSKPTKMAVRILVRMAAEETDRVQTVREVARTAQIPAPSAAKILQALAKYGILASRKGPRGGFRLALLPSEILLARIVEAVEGESHVDECVGGLLQCADRERCSVHAKWASVKEKVAEFIETTSLAEMFEASQHAKFASI